MSRELPWLLTGAVVLAAMVLLRRPAGMILRLLGRSALGMGVLAILEAAGLLSGFGLGVNMINGLTLGLLGVPGFGLLLMGRWLLR